MNTTGQRITMEREFAATPQELWELWTTREGIEAWWGPEGFAVTVRELELVPGGRMLYDMTAVEPGTVAFMERAGMPTTTAATITFQDVVVGQRLAYVHLADFIPGVEPYDVETVIELHPTVHGVRLVLSFAPMHDATWTDRATAGWTSELGKLERLVAARATG
jgi:uncharacterized protein YndB with AHSA1/START domain